MTSTDNTSKPLKTVEEILNELHYNALAHLDGSHASNDSHVQQAKADLYQLMLSLVGRNWTKAELESMGQHSVGKALAQNFTKDELRAKLSEHFNREGEV